MPLSKPSDFASLGVSTLLRLPPTGDMVWRSSLRASSSLTSVRQHFVIDLDGADGVEGVLLGVGGQGEDLIAGVVQLVARLRLMTRCTALTPGIFSAAAVSMLLTFAWA